MSLPAAARGGLGYADNEREIVLLTNLLAFGATTIAAIYKERWQIELFFKALKQNLTVKTFVGTSENALRVQIWDSLDRPALAQMASSPLQGQLVSVQPGVHASPQPLYLPGVGQVAPRTDGNAALGPRI